ncbi:MAG: hypothetical protein ACYCWN_06550 [Ferrimicrobium sp.]|uniref:Uncharacterized protein n=1 Tax=Ferrimicrobium acidiphilum TaxID=121039 RepID=A0ABV3Y0K9_9ACTN|nr:hypothetical protein [Ferrimicrobium sp.]
MGQEGPRPELLSVIRWEVPHEQERWWPITSDYVQLLWLPVLGPSSIVLLQRLDLLIGTASRVCIRSEELAQSLGLGHTPTRGSLLNRSLDRCRDFHVLRELVPGLIEVPRELPPLSSRQLRRLPASLQVVAATRPELHRYRTIADREGRQHQLSATLASLGAEDDEIVDQLVRLGYAPPSHPGPGAIEQRSAHQTR